MTQPTPTLRGVLTALVTPFNRDNTIDFGALDALVDRQLAAGVTGLVPCGTTGESATLTAKEREQIIRVVTKKAAGRVPVIGGAGSNNTAAAIETQRLVYAAGADFALVATPYYNKPTPEGLYRHYVAVSDAAPIPIVLYNIPGRTACDMKPELVGRLAKLKGVVGIKEATGDLDRVMAIRELSDPGFSILCGEDNLTFPFVALGGDGVISAASNVAPVEMVNLTKAALDGNVVEARQIHGRLRPLFKALFLESNPIPMKAALSMMGQIQEIYRLPLCEMQEQTREQLAMVLRAGGWVKSQQAN
jgi:4-hydroxy-tetrahydrodipicolinate synthase